MPPNGEAVGARGSGVFTVDLSAALIGLALQPLLSQEDFFDKVREFSYCNKITQGSVYHPR